MQLSDKIKVCTVVVFFFFFQCSYGKSVCSSFPNSARTKDSFAFSLYLLSLKSYIFISQKCLLHISLSLSSVLTYFPHVFLPQAPHISASLWFLSPPVQARIIYLGQHLDRCHSAVIFYLLSDKLIHGKNEHRHGEG